MSNWQDQITCLFAEVCFFFLLYEFYRCQYIRVSYNHDFLRIYSLSLKRKFNRNTKVGQLREFDIKY